MITSLMLPFMNNNSVIWIILISSTIPLLIYVGIDGVIRTLNPFNKAHFDLPHLSTFPTVVDYQPDLQDNEYTTHEVGDRNIKQDDLMALAIYGDQNRLAWCKFGDTKWTNFSTPEITCPCLEDVIFYEGKIYGISWNAQLYVFDVKTSIGGFSEVPKPCDLNLRSVTERDYVLVVGYNSSVCMLPFSDGEGNWFLPSSLFPQQSKIGENRGSSVGVSDYKVNRGKDLYEEISDKTNKYGKKEIEKHNNDMVEHSESMNFEEGMKDNFEEERKKMMQLLMILPPLEDQKPMRLKLMIFGWGTSAPLNGSEKDFDLNMPLDDMQD
ncbi:hypothetical protein RIF29_21862 [Crotalaria pallida]|uniref:KIB1-4 beta-propeller domain-containing protein n=1 Tax=Crotalaria pallida TaxID=3830 RepID=A0AAN9F7N3_CROPI